MLDSWLINVERAELLPAGSGELFMNAGLDTVQLDGEPLKWELFDVNPIIGSALVIKFNRIVTAGS